MDYWTRPCSIRKDCSNDLRPSSKSPAPRGAHRPGLFECDSTGTTDIPHPIEAELERGTALGSENAAEG